MRHKKSDLKDALTSAGASSYSYDEVFYVLFKRAFLAEILSFDYLNT